MHLFRLSYIRTSFHKRSIALLFGAVLFSLLPGCKKGTEVAPIAMPPASPTNLSAHIVSSGQIDLTWTDNSNDEKGFKIERKAEGGSFAELTTVAANTTTYSDFSIAKNTGYTYRVIAFNAVGSSRNYTNEAALTSIDDAPAAATGIQTVSVGYDHIRIAWTDVATNETNYVVVRKAAGTDSMVVTLPANANGFSDSALYESTAYTYSVYPKNNYGAAPSASLTVSTIANTVTGLVAYYPFHGSAADSSGNGNHGMVVGATLTSDRFNKSNEAYFFNTDSIQYIKVDASSSLNNCKAITLSMWVKLNTYNRPGQVGFNHFVNKSDQADNHQFILASNLQGLYFYFNSGDSYFQSQTLPALNEWHQIAITYAYDPGSPSWCKIYVDGTMTERFPVTRPLPVTSFPLQFGSFASLGNSTLDGRIDEVRIYDRALPAAAIQYLYSH